MKGVIIVIGASLLWLTSCAQETSETTTQNQLEVDAAQVIRVSKASFKTILDANPDAALVDVRTPDEYNAGKIDNAINVDFLNATFESEISKLDKNSLTLIYCRSGGRSAKALKQMKALGFTNVRELEGGYLGW
jgi:rhodanese-related sulfurtransferase